MLRRVAFGTAMGVVLAAQGWGNPALAEDYKIGDLDLSVSGYLRNYAGINLEDPPELQTNDRFRPSMLRNQARVDAKLGGPGARLVTSIRAAQEIKTPYEEELVAARHTAQANTQDRDLLGQYNTLEARELYLDADIGKRVNMRVGRQQIVWGETDFFQGTDLIHGFDYRWRLFFEDNEETRKPLWLGRVMIQVPEANNGLLDAWVRPGLDRGQDIGNSYAAFGGRWATQPFRTTDFFNVTPYNWGHSKGDKDDPTFGARWSGMLGNNLNYSLMYLRTFNQEPIINPNPAIGGKAYGSNPNGAWGEVIFPMIDTVGGTASFQVAPIDTVISTEVAYTPNKPYNYGPDFKHNVFGLPLPGFAGVTEEDLVRLMVRADKSVDLSGVLGTSRPSFASIQLFDNWLPGIDKNTGIVNSAFAAARTKEHSVMLTGILAMNYSNDTINPSIAVGWDATYGGMFVVPAVEFVLGENFRIKAEADLFITDGSRADSMDPGGDTGTLGLFSNSSQFVVKTTYQY